jgi:hypothetical protein
MCLRVLRDNSLSNSQSCMRDFRPSVFHADCWVTLLLSVIRQLKGMQRDSCHTTVHDYVSQMIGRRKHQGQTLAKDLSVIRVLGRIRVLEAQECRHITRLLKFRRRRKLVRPQRRSSLSKQGSVIREQQGSLLLVPLQLW